jgi:hypothetical protein
MASITASDMNDNPAAAGVKPEACRRQGDAWVATGRRRGVADKDEVIFASVPAVQIV